MSTCTLTISGHDGAPAASDFRSTGSTFSASLPLRYTLRHPEAGRWEEDAHRAWALHWPGACGRPSGCRQTRNPLRPSSEGAPFKNRAIVGDCLRGRIPPSPLVVQGVRCGPCEQLLQKADLFGQHFNLRPEDLFGLFVMDRSARSQLTFNVNDRLLPIEGFAYFLFQSPQETVERFIHILWTRIPSAYSSLVLPSPHGFQIFRVLISDALSCGLTFRGRLLSIHRLIRRIACINGVLGSRPFMIFCISVSTFRGR